MGGRARGWGDVDAGGPAAGGLDARRPEHSRLFPPAVLQRNFLAVAKSGKGKSTLMLALALAAFPEPQSGVTVIDPHGDLVERLLTLIPDERRDQTILIDLADTAYPVALNPSMPVWG